MKSQLFWKQLEPSWKLFVKHKRFVALAVIFDLIFYYYLILLHGNIFKVIAVKLKPLNAQMQQAYAAGGAQSMEAFLATNAEMIATFQGVVQDLALFLLGFFGLWLVFKGANWYLANHTIKKTNLLPFAKRFIGLSIIWLLFFVLLVIISLALIKHATGPLPVFSEPVARYMGMGLIWLMGYFMYLSYVQKGLQCFAFGWKHLKKIFPAYVVASLIFFVASSTTISLAQLHRIGALAFIAFVSLPALAFSRMYIAKVVQATK